MADQAHDWTDEQIEALERKFNSAYSQAEREMRAKLDEYLKDFDEKNKVWQAEVRAGRATHEQYQGWLKSQSLRREYLSDMCDTLAADASRTNQLAFGMINDELPRIYAENANYAAYSIESQLHSNTHAFDLVDQSTVRRLMGLDDDGQVIKEVVLSEEEVSPPLRTLRKVNVKKAKDVRWNRQKFNAALTQSILQGESIPNTAKRMARVLNMDKNMAVRAARTAMTSAENAGRVDSYQRAKGIGIDLEQEWLATLDERTRHSHRELDGQHVPVGEKFKVPSSGNELEFPADPTADPSEVWNCRCTLVAWFPEDGVESAANRFSKLPKDMTYDDWKNGKKAEQKRMEASGVVDGKDILGTWKRRPDQFDFEIKDVLNAQGFDGKPRVVSAEEFDAAVKAANGGNGFIAQRSYSAPDQDTLDAYRQMLYEGEFYVDCSAGGANFGQGMYCASDYTGTLSNGIKDAMRHYIELGERRLSASVDTKPVSYIETVTLDPSAKIISYNDLLDMTDSVIDRMVEEGTISDMPNDSGALAAAMGYDAINAEGHGASGSYTVVLNRTKLIIRRPE